MKKSLVEIYALAVCFITVGCFVIVAAIAAWDVVQLAAPKFTINNNEYEAHLTDQQYSNWLVLRNQYQDERYAPPSGAELTSARITSWEQAIKSEQRGALQSLAKNFIIFAIAAFAFMAHWRMAKRSRSVQT